MSTRLGAAVLLVLLAAPSVGEEGATEKPVYSGRLRMPSRSDGFDQPRAVVADLHAEEVFVCDTFNNRVAIFDRQGIFRHQIIGGTTFRAPVDIALDPEGYILLLATHRGRRTIARLDFDGRLLGEVALNGLPPDAVEPRLVSIAISRQGDRLYLLDAGNHRLWITDRQGEIGGTVDLAAHLTDEEAEEQVLGHVDAYDDTVLVAVPSDGLVYLFDLAGGARGTVGTRGTARCQTAFPVAAALDADGRILVLDKQRAMFMTWEPESNNCLSEHYGFGNAAGAFYQPGDLALDGSGRLYVSQGFDGRVQFYDGAVPAARANP